METLKLLKKIKKEHIIGFFIGLLTVLIMDLMLNTEKYIDAFNEGFNKAHQDEEVNE
ncbi:MAG: hypothetical protein ACQETL_10070 [Bacteroidota bacterium]